MTTLQEKAKAALAERNEEESEGKRARLETMQARLAGKLCDMLGFIVGADCESQFKQLPSEGDQVFVMADSIEFTLSERYENGASWTDVYIAKIECDEDTDFKAMKVFYGPVSSLADIGKYLCDGHSLPRVYPIDIPGTAQYKMADQRKTDRAAREREKAEEVRFPAERAALALEEIAGYLKTVAEVASNG